MSDNKGSTLAERVVDEMSATISDIDTRIGENTDAVGITTLFARLRQIVDTYLADGTAGLAALKTLIDANQVDLNTIIADTETLLQKATKIITLSTAAVPVTETLFTVTGEVELYIIGYIDTAVTSAGALTLEVGIAGATAGLIAQTAVADLLIDLLWVNATPAILISKPSEKIIANGADISHIIKTAAATAGAITYYAWWKAISADGNVTAI